MIRIILKYFLGAYLRMSTESIQYNLLTIAKGTQDPRISELNLIKCLNFVQFSVSSSLNLANICRKDDSCRTWNTWPNQTHAFQSSYLQQTKLFKFNSNSRSFDKHQNLSQMSAWFGLVGWRNIHVATLTVSLNNFDKYMEQI